MKRFRIVNNLDGTYSIFYRGWKTIWLWKPYCRYDGAAYELIKFNDLPEAYYSMENIKKQLQIKTSADKPRIAYEE